jgi:CBS domain-containing protein
MTPRSTLGDVVTGKRTGLVMVDEKTPLRRAVQLMNEVRSGAVLVTDRSALVGIVTERDVLRRIVARQGMDLSLPLTSVMTSPVQCAPASMIAEDAIRLMSRRYHRHLAVLEGGVPVGIVSIGDLMNVVTRELEQRVIDLSTFISGPAATVEFPSAALAARALPSRDDTANFVTHR